MNKSETIVKLAEALALAQAEMPAVKFNSTNPFLKNKYADLGAIIETSQPILAKFGLSVSQFIYSEAEQVGVETMLMHKSGEWMNTKISMATADEKGKSNAQVAGSIVTYLRRYSLAAILNMFADEDGDGNKVKIEKHEWTPVEVEAGKPENPKEQASTQTPTSETKVTTPTTDKPDPEPQKPVKTSNGKYARPMSPETLKEAFAIRAQTAKPASDKQTALVRILLTEYFADKDDVRQQAQEYLTGHRHFADIPPQMISTILDWMKPVINPDGSGSYVLDKAAKIELTNASNKFMAELGQEALI